MSLKRQKTIQVTQNNSKLEKWGQLLSEAVARKCSVKKVFLKTYFEKLTKLQG